MDTNRIYHDIVKEILESIDSGTFPVGSRLPSERVLAKKFSVSRSCVREAQIVLEAQGRLKVKAGSGAYVSNKDDVSKCCLPYIESFELTEARALFEAEVVALAAPLITDENIIELEKLVGIMRGDVESNMTPDEADASFHNLIARATNNRVIMFTIENMWKMRAEVMELQKNHRKVYCKEGRYLEDKHLAIIEALKNRNPAEARKATQDHFTRIMKALLAASEVDAYQEMKRKTSENRSRFLMSMQLS